VRCGDDDDLKRGEGRITKEGILTELTPWAVADASLLRKLEAVAKASSGGHLTIMRFGSNWRVGFVTPNSRYEIQAMTAGATFAEAAERALHEIRDGYQAAFYARAQECEKAMWRSIGHDV
jgi:hypothetical protein